MSFASVGKVAVVGGEVVCPRIGAWRASLTLAANELDLTGQQTLTVGGVEFVGTVDDARSGVEQGGKAFLHMRGGAGGLATVVQPKAYVSSPARVVLEDLAAAAGETLASDIDATLLNTTLPQWHRAGGDVRTGIRSLADALGVSWRVGRDGLLWIGAETWPATEIDEYTQTSEDKAGGTMVIATEEPLIYAGETFSERKVESVKYEITSAGLRATIEFDGGRSLEKQFEGAIKRITGDSQYKAPLAAQVVRQNADGSVELKVFSDKIPHMSKVPLRLGLPGCNVTVQGGIRGVVEFEDGDPRKPVFTSWESGQADKVDLIELGDADDFVALKLDIDAIWDAISAAGVTPNDGGAAFKAAIIAARNVTCSTKVKA
jgi:hypothetical protein